MVASPRNVNVFVTTVAPPYVIVTVVVDATEPSAGVTRTVTELFPEPFPSYVPDVNEYVPGAVVVASFAVVSPNRTVAPFFAVAVHFPLYYSCG